MELAAKMDEWGKPAWIAAMVLGFIVFWPIGLAILAYMIWSGRMSCSRNGGFGRWHNTRSEFKKWKQRGSSGNAAFDEYRGETLRRLEDEQREFQDFLERLRHAKDKQEFDQFMDERRRAPKDGEAPKDRGPGDPVPQPQG